MCCTTRCNRPWKLIICPSFNAAPRIFDSLATSLSILAELKTREDPLPAPFPVARRRLSPAAPAAIDAAKPPYCHSRPNRDEGTLDSRISKGFLGCEIDSSFMIYGHDCQLISVRSTKDLRKSYLWRCFCKCPGIFCNIGGKVLDIKICVIFWRRKDSAERGERLILLLSPGRFWIM